MNEFQSRQERLYAEQLERQRTEHLQRQQAQERERRRAEREREALAVPPEPLDAPGDAGPHGVMAGHVPGYSPVLPPLPDERPSLEARFAAYHEANPQVYRELVKLARRGVERGRKRLGISQLFEVLRWNTMMTTDDPDGFKLNNDYRAGYARLIMEREADLAGVFEMRRSRLDEAEEE